MRSSIRQLGALAHRVAAIAAACCCTTLSAQPAIDDPLTAAIAGVPQQARLVVVVPRTGPVLSALRSSPVLAQYLGGAMSQTHRGWLRLARSLEYQPAEALEHLTSGGVALVVFDPADAPEQPAHELPDPQAHLPRHLAVLTIVEAPVARRVMEKLQARPRGVIAGQPVYSLDAGTIAMVLRPVHPAEPDGRHLLILAPGDEQDATLTALLLPPDAPRPTPTLGATDAFASAAAHRADLLVMARLDHLPDPSLPAAVPRAGTGDWSNALLATARFEHRRWTCQLRWPAPGPLPPTLAPHVAGAVDRLDADGCSVVVAFPSAPGDVFATAPAQVLTLGGVLVGDLAAAASSQHAQPQAGSILAIRPGVPGPEGEPTPAHILLASTLPAESAHARTDRVGTDIVNALRASGTRPGRARGPVPTAVDAAHFAQVDPLIPRAVPVQLAPGMAAMPIVGTRACITWFTQAHPGAASSWQWGVWSINPTDDPERAEGLARRTARLLSPAPGADAPPVPPRAAAPAAEPPQPPAYTHRAVVKPGLYAQSMAQGVGLALIGFVICDTIRYDQWQQGGTAHATAALEWNPPALTPPAHTPPAHTPSPPVPPPAPPGR